MPKYRQLHTKILDSNDFNEMPDDFTRLVWLLLPCVLDGEGRGRNNTMWIRSHMFPIREDVTLSQIEMAMTWLTERGMVVTYEVDDRHYFHVPTFKTYQRFTEREAPSMIPSPPTQELLASESRLKTYTDSYTETEAEVEAEVDTDADTGADASLSLIIDSYKHYIGKCTGITENILQEALKEYPADWFPKAFEIAAGSGHKRWDYSEGILKNWKANGVAPPVKGNGKWVDRTSDEARRRYAEAVR